MSEPKYRYEVRMPYHQYLHFYVNADSEQEALAKVDAGLLDGESSEDHSTGCGPGAKVEVIKLGPAKEE